MLFLSLLRAGDQNRVIKIQSHPGLLSEVGLFCLNKGRIGMGLMSSLKGDFKFSCLWSVMSVLDQELEWGFVWLTSERFLVKIFAFDYLLGRAMRVMAPCQLGMLFEIFLWKTPRQMWNVGLPGWKLRDAGGWMSPNPPPGSPEGVMRTVACQVANLRKDKPNHKRENGATGGIWLLLHVEDFQDISSESR